MARAEPDFVPAQQHRSASRLSAGLGLAFLPVALAACQTLGERPKADASMGLLIAQNNCGNCHQTGGGGDSPNPNAPAFGEIVNRPGMTSESLAAWLRDAHNYPIEMGFHLEPHHVESLALYMIRWRHEPAAGS